ncbi:YciI family protein [Streptomyces sp. GC420]|uniref:YciI family protein n=1 Tax=Streptomyces sp. GC420 TaxID=2697568 RepID=UPI001414CC6B|nr:YciI family protein [Streptomyces sp. GC420]NBM20121.1 transcriptional regulator [Streptomyces sp. GC420]
MPRYMTMVRIDESNVPAGGPSEQLMEDMGKLIDEMTKAGVLLDTAGLRPTAEGVRMRNNHGEISATDGPFTESKEIIGGYAIIQAKSMEEAREWTQRFLKVHGEDWDITSEVRQIEEPPGA